MPDGSYALADLCDLADVTPRTVRYYVAQGLLRSPGTTGPGARYDDGHLARLRLIRRLQREHLPLAEIRARLAAVTDDEAVAQSEGPAEPPPDSALDYVRGALGAGRPGGAALRPAALRAGLSESAPGFAAQRGPLRQSLLSAAAAESPPPPASGPVAGERSSWERHVLAADIELHVRRPLTRSQNRAVARLLEAARQILEEDQP